MSLSHTIIFDDSYNIMWQSRVETKDYTVVYFDYIATFKVSYR